MSDDRRAAPHCRLAAACLFRDSTFFLREWIEYHMMLGVERFYMCDHLSTDDAAGVLAPYVAQGIVVYLRRDAETPWKPGGPGFNIAFENHVHVPFFRAAIRAADAAGVDWLMLLDSDEFVTLRRQEDSDLRTVLARHERDDVAAIYVNWRLHGTSGLWRKPPEALVVDSLVMRTHDNAPCNTAMKSIVRPDRIATMTTPHWVTPLPGRGLPRFTDGRPGEFGLLKHISMDELALTHYRWADGHYYHTIKWPFYRKYFVGSEYAPTLQYCEVLDRTLSDRFGPTLQRRVLGPRTCVVLHYGSPAEWPFYRPYLNNLREAGVPYDLYVTVHREHWSEGLAHGFEALRYGVRDATDPASGDRPVRVRPVEIITVPNRGMDSGAWLLTLARIDALGRTYDRVLKIHTKSARHRHYETWRDTLMDAVAGSPERVRECTALLDAPGHGVGMVGAAAWMRSSPVVDNEWVASVLDLPAHMPPLFIGGGIFWARFEPLMRPVVGRGEAVRAAVDAFQPGYVQDGAEAHAVERLLAVMVRMHGLQVVGIAPPPRKRLADADTLNAIEQAGSAGLARDRALADTLRLRPVRWDSTVYLSIEDHITQLRSRADSGLDVLFDIARRCCGAVLGTSCAPTMDPVAHIIGFGMCHGAVVTPDQAAGARKSCLSVVGPSGGIHSAQWKEFASTYAEVGVDVDTTSPASAPDMVVVDASGPCVDIAHVLATEGRRAVHWVIVRGCPRGIDPLPILSGLPGASWRIDASRPATGGTVVYTRA